jgi:hypothetical protein
MSSIQKFRTFEEAEKALFCFKPDEAYYERVARLWNFVDLLSPRQYARGIFRYRSIEEANEQADEWMQANAKLANRDRSKGGAKVSGQQLVNE